jgi:sugar O-acyltransferase (sialic acid O-acetyltransferase NeuD family)
MEKLKKLIIVGNGETALLAYEYFTFDSQYEVVAFSVEKDYMKDIYLNNLPVVPFEGLIDKFSIESHEIFIAVSSSNLNRLRTKFYLAAKEMGYSLASYVSSKAFLWPNVKIGENCFILENNTIQPFVEIGNNVTLWSGNHIGHRSVIKDHCFITSHVVISGFCVIKESSFIGVNSTISDNIIIERDCLISLGSVISKNTVEGAIYKGNPATKHKLSTSQFFQFLSNHKI